MTRVVVVWCLVVLTCMFVMRMCFLALVTASLLQEESSTLHHEEALTQAADKTEESRGYTFWEGDTARRTQLRRATFWHSGTQHKWIFFLVWTGCFCSVRRSQRDHNKSRLSAAGESPQQLSGKAQLPRYRARRQVCSRHESSFDPECLSVFFSAAWAALRFDLSGLCWLGIMQHRSK